MFYGCRCRCRRHFELFTSQSMIEFTAALHNAVARKHHMTIKRGCLYCRYSRISNRLTVDMHVQSIDSPESIDNVIIYILATLQWAKISFATLLSTFYFYLTSYARKCINYCMHCRHLKYIHYYSFNFRLFIFDHKSDAICKTIKAYNAFIYVDTPPPYSLIPNTDTQTWQESHEKLVWYTKYVWCCVIWSILNKVLQSKIGGLNLCSKFKIYFFWELATWFDWL